MNALNVSKIESDVFPQGSQVGQKINFRELNNVHTDQNGATFNPLIGGRGVPTSFGCGSQVGMTQGMNGNVSDIKLGTGQTLTLVNPSSPRPTVFTNSMFGPLPVGRDLFYAGIIICGVSNIIFHVLMARYYHTSVLISCVPFNIPSYIVSTNCDVLDYNTNMTTLTVKNVCNEPLHQIIIPSTPITNLHFGCYYNTTFCETNSTDSDQINTHFFDLTSNYNVCVHNRNESIFEAEFLWAMFGILLMLLVLPALVFLIIHSILTQLDITEVRKKRAEENRKIEENRRKVEQRIEEELQRQVLRTLVRTDIESDYEYETEYTTDTESTTV